MTDSVASEEFEDPRLVAVYDTLNGYAPNTQPDFYVGLARELRARTVVEIGCGTGLVTAAFVEAGFEIVGLEPSGPMLDAARRRPAALGARWVHGPVDALDVRNADLVVMAGHEVLTARTVLRFRSREEVEASLWGAGFVVERCYGGWDRRLFTGREDEIVVMAAADRPR